MEDRDGISDASSTAVLACLGTAGVFEVLTVPALQDRAAWAASPWREDPYHTVVSLAQFTVLMLGLVTALRLLARRAPGAPDRAQQLARAAGATTALIAVALAFEWTAVLNGAHGWTWGTWNTVLVGGLAVVSVLTAAVTTLLVRGRSPRGSSGRWRHDWLGDVALLGRHVPGLRRWAGPEVMTWVRRRAMTVFVTVSVLAAALFTAADAVGERMTNVLLITWYLLAETACNLAFCVVSNAAAGFIARPPRTTARRAAETSVVAGCVGVIAAIAFHDPLWRVFTAEPLTVGGLFAVTFGAGLAAALATAAVLRLRTSRPALATPADPDDPESV